MGKKFCVITFMLLCCYLASACAVDVMDNSIKQEGMSHSSVRYLHQFKGANGQTPDGKDSMRDDTAAMTAALNAGPCIVNIAPGYYRIGSVTIPEKVILVGSGGSTIIRSNGAKRIFNQSGVGHWAIRDLVLDGQTKFGADPSSDIGMQSLYGKDGNSIPDNNQTGLFIEKCYAFEIRNIVAHHFEGKAIEISQSDLSSGAFCNGGTICSLTLYHNNIGIAFSERAEYITATHIKSYRNVIGCIINGGNITIGESTFCTNETGILLQDKENGSHGAIVNCLINHNMKYAIVAKDVRNGHNFVGCSIFDGTLKMENCRGIKIASGTLDCSIAIDCNEVNQISGNFVSNGYMKICQISPNTIVKDNFNAEGAWIPKL